MTNENCLEGRKCPTCGQCDKLQIAGAALFDVVDNGIEKFHDVEYDDSSLTMCPACEWVGVLAETSEDYNQENAEERLGKPITVFGHTFLFGYDKTGFSIRDNQGYNNSIFTGVITSSSIDLKATRFILWRFVFIWARHI